MPADAKYLEVAATLEQRLRSGAYMLQNFRSERRIAEEMGVSHMTARKAVQQLLERGLLERQTNGRLKLRSEAHCECAAQHIGFIAPATPSLGQLSWQQSITNLVASRGGVVRPIFYYDASDATLFDALASDLDGFFLWLPREVPSLLLDRLIENKQRAVVLFQNWTHVGIPSIQNGPSRFVGLLLDHLQQLGHRRIDAICLDPTAPVHAERVEHWQYGLEQRGLQGRLHKVPLSMTESYVDDIHHYVRNLIQQPDFNATAICGMTTEFAWASMRGCHDVGLKIGRDISFCGFGEMQFAQTAIPSITAVQPADRAPLITAGLEWIATRGRNWSRPLRLEPESISLFIGESTGPAPV